MCTRSMNLGCFCMVFLGVLIFFPFGDEDRKARVCWSGLW
jgi:hypothetical protein